MTNQNYPLLPLNSSSPTTTTPRPTNPPPHRKTTHLDGLRGLASLLVFLQHYFQGFALFSIQDTGFGQHGNYPLCTFPFLRLLWSGGHAAVVVFFIVSGYVLSIGPLTKIREGEGRGVRRGLVGAGLRRPVRLYLPPLVVTGVTAGLMHVPGPLVGDTGFSAAVGSLGEEMGRWGVEFGWFFWPFREHGFWAWDMFGYDIAVWTLPIELKGSFWIYGVVLGLSVVLTGCWKDTGRGKVGCAFAVLSTLAVGMLQTNFKWSGAAFTFGILLAIVDTWSLDLTGSPGHAMNRTRSVIYNCCFVAGWYLLSQPTRDRESSLQTPGWNALTSLTPAAYGEKEHHRYWSCWGGLLLVYAVLRLQWLQTFFSSRPLRLLGRVSFMLYLVHLPFFRILPDRIHSMVGGFGLPKENKSWFDNKLWIPDVGPLGLNTRWLLSVAISLPLTLLLAEIATRYVDNPSVALAERFASVCGFGRGHKREPEDSTDRLPRSR